MDTPRADATMWSALPDAIPAPTFRTAKRGFEQKQVLEHVDRLNDRLRTVEHQVRQLRFEAEQAKRERDAALRERAASCKHEMRVTPRRYRSPRGTSTPTSTCPSA